MKHKRLWLAAGLVLAAAAVAVYFLLIPKIEEHPASIIEAVNRVEAHPRPDDAWQPAVTGMSVYGGGQVRTGSDSSARLTLLEGVVRLAADTLFTVKACETHQNQVITTLFLQEGRLWAHLTAGQPHQFTVETVGAVAAVRDTDLSVRVAPDRTTLVSVARGQVALTAQGERVTVTAGQQAVVSPGRPPGAPEPMSDEERRLWATEGEIPELAPPTPTATATPTPTPTPKPSPTATPVKISLWVDVYGHLTGPAGEPAGQDPLTILEVHTDSDLVAGVTVTTPAGQIITLPPYGDVYGQQRRFTQVVPGLPQTGGRYTFTALAADGQPLPGGVASDIYLGGYEPEPPVGVSAQAVDNGLLVTWKPSPLIPGAFNPAAASSLGFYQISLHLEGRGTAYGWNNSGRPLPETAHLIPLRQQDFGPGDFGQALAQLDDGLYFLDIDAFSVAPPQTVGGGLECSANDPAESVKIIIEAGQVRVESPMPTPATPTPTPTLTPSPALSPTPAPPPGPQNSVFVSQDGQQLAGTYYPPPVCSAPITVVYFPWVRGDRNDWNEVAAVLPPDTPPVGAFSITTRGCEGSCGDVWDRPGWLLDYAAAVKAVQALPCAQQSRLVAIGSSVGADGAIYACARQEKCVGALAFSANGYLNVPYEEEVAAMVQQGKQVWSVVSEGDTGAARLNRPEWSQFYHEIVLPGQEHGNQLYNPATGQLIKDFVECAANSFGLPKCATISAGK